MHTFKRLRIAISLALPVFASATSYVNASTLPSSVSQTVQAEQSYNDIQNARVEGVTMQALTLETKVGPLAANLYLPEGDMSAPLVIVTGAWTSVKEQMPAVYAKALAEKGFAALTFDFRGWGETQRVQHLAQPFVEDPTMKTQDIVAIIDAAGALRNVDTANIAGLAICASAGYMLDAALEASQLRAVAVVAPWLHDKPMATAIYGGEENAAQLLAAASDASHKAVPQIIEASSLENENALMYQVPYYTEKNRGLISAYDNKFNLLSWQGWLNYDAQQSAPKQEKPILMVGSETMALPQGAHQYLESAGDNVNAVWLDGFTQFDFYDQPEAVSKAVTAVSEHFNRHL